jgi:hypothetical protein
MSTKKCCPSCLGEGKWEAECCNGMGGCSCAGRPVDMGYCNVCGGSGEVVEGEFDDMANVNFLMNSGACFIGTGPSSGFWADKPALGITPNTHHQ